MSEIKEEIRIECPLCGCLARRIWFSAQDMTILACCYEEHCGFWRSKAVLGRMYRINPQTARELEGQSARLELEGWVINE